MNAIFQVISKFRDKLGFSALQTLLVFYLGKDLEISSKTFYFLYLLFSSFIYLSSDIGEFIARPKRFKTAHKFVGSILLLSGYYLCALNEIDTFIAGLIFVILGSSLLKPQKNISPQQGYTLLYIAINIGAWLPYLLADKFQDAPNWSLGVLLASFSVLLSCWVITLSQESHFGRYSFMKIGGQRHFSLGMIVFFGLIFSVLLVSFLLHLSDAVKDLLLLIAFFVVGLIFVFLRKTQGENRQKMIAAIIVMIISMIFWALYNQTYTTILTFADTHLECHWLGVSFSPSGAQYVNPLFLLILTPAISKLWNQLDQKKINPSTPTKFSLGALFVALGFFLLGTGITYFGCDGHTSLGWLLGSFFLQTLGELMLAPLSMMMISNFVPQSLSGMMTAVWFLSQFAAYAIGWGLANVAKASNLSPIKSLGVYSHAFFFYGFLALLLSMVSYALSPRLKDILGYSKEV
jgi:POT family proton-dependent oligopeptide transporter